MDPAIAVLDLVKAGAIIANMIESYLVACGLRLVPARRTEVMPATVPI